MNLYLVRVDNEDGENLDQHVIARSPSAAVELWKQNADLEDEWSTLDGFLVHLVMPLGPRIPDHPLGPRTPQVLSWSDPVHFPVKTIKDRSGPRSITRHFDLLR